MKLPEITKLLNFTKKIKSHSLNNHPFKYKKNFNSMDINAKKTNVKRTNASKSDIRTSNTSKSNLNRTITKNSIVRKLKIENSQKSKKIINYIFSIGIITFIAIIFYNLPICKKFAIWAESIIIDEQNVIEEYWTPPVPQPIYEVENIFPEISHSSMLSLATDYYLGQNETTIENIDLFSAYFLGELEQRNQSGELLELPASFRIRETTPIQEFYTSENIDVYDGQLFDAYQDAINTYNSLSYHRIGITALNVLNLLKKTGNTEQDDYIYYGELAFWGFMNEYILDRPTEGARADWFYRVAQIYDYLGGVTNDNDLPLRHEMYFISAGLLHLSFNSLSSFNFDEDKCSIYRNDIWELDLIMLYRLGIYFNDNESFFSRLIEHSEIIYNLPLTSEEENAVQDILNKVNEWKYIYNS